MLNEVIQQNTQHSVDNERIVTIEISQQGNLKISVKLNFDCRRNIAITVSYISILFHLDTPRIGGVTAV